MKKERPGRATPAQMPATSSEAAEINELRKAQDLWRLIGDPRIRVEVRTENDAKHPPPAPASQRYQTG
jgi:hypothetical protein